MLSLPFMYRLIAEQSLGRPLEKNEIVHHINGRKLDNREENLCICTRAEHVSIHYQSMEVIAELIERGIVYFDKSDKEYKVKKDN